MLLIGQVVQEANLPQIDWDVPAATPTILNFKQKVFSILGPEPDQIQILENDGGVVNPEESTPNLIRLQKCHSTTSTDTKNAAPCITISENGAEGE